MPLFRTRNVVATLAAAALTVGGLTLIPDARAATFERGPAPSRAGIEAARGPFATSQVTVARSAVSGFGGGDIVFPTDTSAGTFGAVAIAPGFTARRSSMAWIVPRLASQGFVVFNIDTLTTSDQPASRGRQLLAALDFLTERSSVRTRVDASRLAVMGHSMGGGGSLEAATSRNTLQAAIPLTPWDLNRNFGRSQVPTLIIGAERDAIAPVRQHSEPFFASLPDTLDSAYLELAGASHFAPNVPNTTIASTSIAWLKRFVDDDTRYDQFLCPGPARNAAISEFEINGC
ncbi:alpha/beta hydrolase [Actinoplanes sp. TRM 88003]|uniref:Alpha/beta hydrolase n=1 Tax=Paractinoplanes aksuensis TaxID=2939490 RepID=A0ABT1DH06_9ACTN|nr:alpha/beta hydrolase [Actinoplanes aksuensis]MCO8269066.1 alpha/beta hydrolase [Actinoplanes aksuensis]